MQGTAIITNSTDLVLGNYVIEGFREGVRLSTYGSSLPASPTFAANAFLGNRSAIATGHPLIFWREPSTFTFNDCRERIRWMNNPTTFPIPECVVVTTTQGYYRNIYMDLSCNLFDPGKRSTAGGITCISRAWLSPSPGNAIGIDLQNQIPERSLLVGQIGRPSSNPNAAYLPGANVWPVAVGINRAINPDASSVKNVNSTTVPNPWSSPTDWTSIAYATGTRPIYYRFSNEFLGTCSTATGSDDIIPNRTGAIQILASNSNALNCQLADDNNIFPTSAPPSNPTPNARVGFQGQFLSTPRPNPANELVQFDYQVDEDVQNLRFEIIGVANGLLVYSSNLNFESGNIEVNIKRLASGTYFCRLTSANKQMSVVKLVVVH